MGRGSSKAGGGITLSTRLEAAERQNTIFQSIAHGMDNNDETEFVNGLADGIMLPYGQKEREQGITPLSRSDVQASIEAFAKMHPDADETRLQEKVDDRVSVLTFPTLSTSEQMAEIKSVQAKQRTAKSYVTKTTKAVDSARNLMGLAETEKLRSSYQKKLDKAMQRQDVAVRTQARWDKLLNAYEDIYRKRK